MASGSFCPSCGSPSLSGARFCANCGTALDAASPSQPEPQPPGQWGLPSRGQGQPGVGVATRQGFGWALGCLIFAVGVGVVVVVLGFIGVSSGTPSEIVPSRSPVTVPSSSAGSLPAGGAAAASGRSPVTVSGSSIGKSDPFRLVGDYAVTWTAQANSQSGCYNGATLERTDGEYTGLRLARDTYDGAALHTGSSNLYGMDGAQFYVDATGSCKWSFTFTPR